MAFFGDCVAVVIGMVVGSVVGATVVAVGGATGSSRSQSRPTWSPTNRRVSVCDPGVRTTVQPGVANAAVLPVTGTVTWPTWFPSTSTLTCRPDAAALVRRASQNGPPVEVPTVYRSHSPSATPVTT